MQIIFQGSKNTLPYDVVDFYQLTEEIISWLTESKESVSLIIDASSWVSTISIAIKDNIPETQLKSIKLFLPSKIKRNADGKYYLAKPKSKKFTQKVQNLNKLYQEFESRTGLDALAKMWDLIREKKCVVVYAKCQEVVSHWIRIERNENLFFKISTNGQDFDYYFDEEYFLAECHSRDQFYCELETNLQNPHFVQYHKERFLKWNVCCEFCLSGENQIIYEVMSARGFL